MQCPQLNLALVMEIPFCVETFKTSLVGILIYQTKYLIHFNAIFISL